MHSLSIFLLAAMALQIFAAPISLRSDVLRKDSIVSRSVVPDNVQTIHKQAQPDQKNDVEHVKQHTKRSRGLGVRGIKSLLGTSMSGTDTIGGQLNSIKRDGISSPGNAEEKSSIPISKRESNPMVSTKRENLPVAHEANVARSPDTPDDTTSPKLNTIHEYVDWVPAPQPRS